VSGTVKVNEHNVPRDFWLEDWEKQSIIRFSVHWDLRESMTEADIEIILERAKERYTGLNRGSFPTTDPRSSPRSSFAFRA
jgi:hypothetical protein